MSNREREAVKTIRKHMVLTAGAGLIPIPLVDMAAVTGVLLMMLAEISKIYGVEFNKNWGKAAISSLLGFIAPHAIACAWIGSVVKSIPVVGYLSGAPTMVILCGAWAWALGHVFIQHFESGGTFLTFDSEKVREYFKTQFEEGKRMAAAMEKEERAAAPAGSIEA